MLIDARMCQGWMTNNLINTFIGCSVVSSSLLWEALLNYTKSPAIRNLCI